MRAFAVSALLALAGSFLMVGSDMWGWHIAVTIAGGVLMAAGFALLAAALLAGRRGRVQVVLSDEGFRIVEPAGVRAGRWSDVTRVTEAPGRLTFHEGTDARVHLVAPPGQAESLRKLGVEVSKRLDNHRGYRPLD